LKALGNQEIFFNRELSWLAFNDRVLQEAQNILHPILERVRFLSIASSNLDEFVMVRIAGLKAAEKGDAINKSSDGMTPDEQLKHIAEELPKILKNQQGCWEDLQVELRKERIFLSSVDQLTREEKTWLEQYFVENIFSSLTPLAIDPAHPFPFIPNLGFSLIIEMSHSSEDKHLSRAIISIPQITKRFVRLPSAGGKYVLLEHVILMFMTHIFPEFILKNVGFFRLLRDSEVELSDDSAHLVENFETALKRRRHGSCIWLGVDSKMPPDLLNFICTELNVPPIDVVRVDGILGLCDVKDLVDIDRVDLKFTPHKPRFPERILDFGGDSFAAIKKKDIIVHHPYESFDVVIQFVRQAAKDPNVVAIKQTLYRTSEDSPVVSALIEAAEAGKSVTAVVELRARFNEEANIQWARNMERAGVSVVYGFVDMKAHVKMTLVTRYEGSALNCYVHFGTGNYHPVNAQVYTDLSFFTSDPILCSDANKTFNFLTGYAKPQSLEKLAISPMTLRSKLYELIDREIEFVQLGRQGTVWAKMNSLVDPDVINYLYKASNSGVKIILIIRGICCLRPGVSGLSENIQVKSLVGRFLEHARIVVTGNGNELPSPTAKVFISSADWMPRNLNNRVETLVPIENKTVHQQVLDQIMVANINDTEQSWKLNESGSYTRINMKEEGYSAHDYFMTNPSLSGQGNSLTQLRSFFRKIVKIFI